MKEVSSTPKNPNEIEVDVVGVKIETLHKCAF